MAGQNFSRAIQRRTGGRGPLDFEAGGLGASIYNPGRGPQTVPGGGSQAPQQAPDVINSGPAQPQTPTPQAPAAIPDAAMPSPGVANVTPGAIERRLGFNPPSFQARGGMAPGPSGAAQAMIQHNPNQQGPARQVLNAPIAGIESLLQRLRQGPGQR